MQTNRERKGRPSKNHPLKRLKSVTKYPRKEPAFIIGFALQETYDNLVTAQQKICGSKSPKSPQASDHTITPKVSTCNYSTGEMEEIQHDSPLPETPLSNAGCDRDEGGDIEVKLPSLDECIITKSTEECRQNRTEQQSSEPEVIFETSKHSKRLKQRTTNKQNKDKYLNKVKNFYNKRKDSKRTNKKICKYFGGNHINLNKLQSESISKMLSRSRMLKKVSAKESLIEDQNLKGTNDGGSVSASFITANVSFFSYSSQDTLTCKDSNKGSDCNVSKTERANSFIRISPDDTFNTVINVSRAIIQSGTYGGEHNTRAVPSNSTVVMQNLTSTETIINPVALTSDPVSEVSSKFMCDNYMNPTVSDISTERVTEGERASTTEASDEEDTFYNAKTSSYFHKSDHESNSEIAIQMDRPDAFFKETFAKADPYPVNSTLMDTVINLGMFPEIASHNSNDYTNDVIVTGNLNHIYQHPKDDQTLCYDQNTADRIVAKNISQKPFCPELNVNYIKPKTDLSFVNETAITDILQGNRKHENVTRTEELSTNNHPSTLSELWEKLLIALDATAKKIEESLSEKIIKEMKATLSILNQSNAMKDVEAAVTPPISAVNNSGDTDVPAKEICPDEAPSKLEQGLQCNLVQNQLIDELMLFKNRSESGKIGQAVLHQSNSKFIEHCLEVLKPPGVIIPDRGDLVTLTDDETVAGPSTKVRYSVQPAYFRLTIVRRFLKDNVFILTSVPIFCGVFIVFYLLIILIVQPF